MNFSGKRFLLTQPTMQRINGATLVALQLGEFLKDQGAEVEIYTYWHGDPVKSACQDAGILLHKAWDDPQLHLSQYDFIWVHSQTLPQTMIDELAAGATSLPIFIFNHMSALPKIGDEYPYIWTLEESLSSLSLFVSEEAKERNLLFYVSEPPMALYPNPAPPSFCRITPRLPEAPERILIVSNHPPKELEEAAALLRQNHGIETEILGETEGTQKILDADKLADYDIVITIGKTVQYCLVAGIPVFIYDHFGGPGYLTPENTDAAAAANFSGRGFDKMSAEEITMQVVDNYGAAMQYQTKNRDAFRSSYALSELLPRLLDKATSCPVKEITVPPSLAACAGASQEIAKVRFTAETMNVWNEYRYQLEHERAEEFSTRITEQELAHQISNKELLANIDELENQFMHVTNEYQRLLTSKRVQLLNHIMQPIDVLRRRRS